MKNFGFAARIEEVSREMNADSRCSGSTASLIPQQMVQILLEL